MTFSISPTLTLGDDDRRLMATQAHYAHAHYGRPDYRHGVSLPSGLMARLLHRTCPPGDALYTYWASADDDTVICGLTTVWKTGGRAVYNYVLQNATERELALHDLVTTLMWASHEARRLHDRQPPLPEFRPHYARWGQPVDTAPWLAFPGEWPWTAANVAALQAEVAHLSAAPAPAPSLDFSREALEAWAAALTPASAICTYAAPAAARIFGGEVWGYFATDNPLASAGREAGHHAFALIGGRYLIDVWRIAFETAGRAVYDLTTDAAEVERIYGPRDLWERVPDEALLEAVDA